jgi:chromosome segregation ATPase
LELADSLGSQLRHNRVAVRGDELGREIESLEAEIASLRALEQEEDSAVTALSAEIVARQGRLSLTRRALADHEESVENKRAQLDEAMAEQARQVFEQVLQSRTKAEESLAEAAEVLLERLAALDGLREEARSAWATAQVRAKAVGKPLDPVAGAELEADETEVMRESWDRLSQEVRKRIDERFEDDLVEAAARSPMGNAIRDLPEHLRELARQRRLALMRPDLTSRVKGYASDK